MIPTIQPRTLTANALDLNSPVNGPARTSGALPLPTLPPPAPGSASARQVSEALASASARLGASIGASGSPSSALMMLLTEVTRANESAQMEQVQDRRVEQKAANEAQQQAIQAAIDQQNDSSLWGKVTQALSYVGAGLALVGSIAALPLSGGASLLASVCAVTALVSSAGSLGLQASTDLGLWQPPPELTITLACIGAAAAGAGAISSLVTGSSQILSGTARAVSTASSVLGSVSKAGQAVSQGVQGYHTAESLERRADAAQAQAQSGDAQFRINALLDGLQQNETVRQRFVRNANGVENACHQSAMINLRA